MVWIVNIWSLLSFSVWHVQLALQVVDRCLDRVQLRHIRRKSKTENFIFSKVLLSQGGGVKGCVVKNKANFWSFMLSTLHSRCRFHFNELAKSFWVHGSIEDLQRESRAFGEGGDAIDFLSCVRQVANSLCSSRHPTVWFEVIRGIWKLINENKLKSKFGQSCHNCNIVNPERLLIRVWTDTQFQIDLFERELQISP